MPKLLALAACLLALSASASARPARVETVRFTSDSLTIAGLLALPARAGARVPGIVLLHGSEPGKRDNPFFRSVRDRLTRAGWAVLTYDRRGVGESGGRYVETPDLREPAADAVAAVRFLRERAEVDGSRVGLLGISQGGWVAPLAATLEPSVAFVVAISEPGMTPLEQAAFHRASELAERGFTPAEIDSATALRMLLFRYWHGDVPRAAADSAWAISRARPWLARAGKVDELFSRLAGLPAVPPPSLLPPDFARALRECFFHDPVPVAERLRVPVLHLYGAADRRVPVAPSVAAFRAAYARSGNSRATIRVLEHAGHGLQRVRGAAECLLCPPETREPWAPARGWLDTLARWLDARK
jgi:pimeloyl-ACP methyl ester carboxylesterase